MKTRLAARTTRGVAVLGLALSLGTVTWAGTPSWISGMPPEVESWRETILQQDAYEELADQWRSYLERHPESALAHVELARALRYAGTAPVEERERLVAKAYELDPNSPEALEAMAEFCLGEHKTLAPTLEEALDFGNRAVALAPHWARPHFGLWSNATLLGREAEAREHLRAILRKGGIITPILDLGYNLLVSADPNAIVFTNGDNDTYPPLALQVVHGTRTDVLIVNLSMLNRLEYALSIWKHAAGGRPLSEDAIRKIHNDWKKRGKKDDRLAEWIIRAMIKKTADGEWTNPVYFAVTVAPTTLDLCDRALEVEGLLWRVKREPEDAKADCDPCVNLAKTLRLFREDFRLESATDLAVKWTEESAARKITSNYPALLQSVATESAKRGDLESTRYALREAIRILSFQGDTKLAERLGQYWKELDPENPEAGSIRR